MDDWIYPRRPADLAESQLLAAILDGSFAVASSLPAERELAQQLGVTRPTLREALQRLSRDGWITIRQGKSTVVNDYWRDGNLIMLNALARQPGKFDPAFIQRLLEVRCVMAPTYTALAVQHAPQQLIEFLKPLTELPNTAHAYAQADPDLHHMLTVLSGNPIYSLIYNAFRELSYTAGLSYFDQEQARESSKAFYQGLLEDAVKMDPRSAKVRTTLVMEKSLEYWNNFISIKAG